jgi:hypothetical protein
MYNAPELTTEEILAAAKATWPVVPHPFLPWFSDADLLDLLNQPDGAAKIATLYEEREKRLFLASDDGDPYHYGFELPHWKDADGLICKICDLLYVAGGKRASKSEWAAKRIVQSAMRYGKGIIWCFQDNERTSISTQQKLIWKYLPPEIRARNGKMDRQRIYKVNYTPANGFADRILVLPNRTEIHFLTYNQEPTDFQGWAIGAPVPPGQLDPNIPNLGAWPDENLPLQWLETIRFRATTNSAKTIWTFSTTEGITTTIKEVLGTPMTLKTRVAELLSDRVNIPGLMRGEMPYIQRCSSRNTTAIYFHSDLNLFGDNYANVKSLCAGKSTAFIEENAYGYARDVMNKAFPLFGEWNIVKPEHIPTKGTNYMFTDPAGARNWATLWVRVTPGGDHYIYRDWPDCQTYGEWATPSTDPHQPDGDAGKAQKSLGYGIEQYKALFRGLENGMSQQSPSWLQVREGAREPEIIFERYIDPRAGRNPHAAEKGGTCIIDEFNDGHDPMHFVPASGVERSVGITHVNSLLYWNKEQPLVPVMNSPRLFVSADALQVIWMMSNYTDRGGEKGACKDFADLVRYMALADLQYYETNEFQSTAPGKGY